MIHDAANQSASTVPEELFNLTQLANVTLAAGKLSTTNIQTIKDYIRCEESTITPSNPNRPLQITELLAVKRSNSSSDASDSSSSEINSPQKLLSDAGYMSDFDYMDKKTFLYALHSNNNQSLDNDTHTMSNLSPTSKAFAEQRQSSFSSSEDDSPYNYSHKIFDKRKSRKQTQNADHHLKLANSFSQNGMGIETEDSMLSISESESNDGDSGRTTTTNRINSIANDLNAADKSTGELTSEAESLNGTSNSDDVHTCPECGKKYSTSSNLARHRQTHRSLLDKKAKRCPHCDKVYVSIPAFSMHLKVSL